MDGRKSGARSLSPPCAWDCRVLTQVACLEPCLRGPSNGRVRNPREDGVRSLNQGQSLRRLPHGMFLRDNWLLGDPLVIDSSATFNNNCRFARRFSF